MKVITPPQIYTVLKLQFLDLLGLLFISYWFHGITVIAKISVNKLIWSFTELFQLRRASPKEDGGQGGYELRGAQQR